MKITGEGDLEFDQGESVDIGLTWTDQDSAAVDLTGCTATANFYRKNAPSPSLTLTTDDDGGLTLTPLSGRIDLAISAAQSAALVEVNDGVWRVDVVFPDSHAKKLLRAKLNVIARNGANA